MQSNTNFWVFCCRFCQCCSAIRGFPRGIPQNGVFVTDCRGIMQFNKCHNALIHTACPEMATKLGSSSPQQNAGIFRCKLFYDLLQDFYILILKRTRNVYYCSSMHLDCYRYASCTVGQPLRKLYCRTTFMQVVL